MSFHIIALKYNKLYKRTSVNSHYSQVARRVGTLLKGNGVEVYMLSTQAIVNNPYSLESAEFADYIREHGLPV